MPQIAGKEINLVQASPGISSKHRLLFVILGILLIIHSVELFYFTFQEWGFVVLFFIPFVSSLLSLLAGIFLLVIGFSGSLTPRFLPYFIIARSFIGLFGGLAVLAIRFVDSGGHIFEYAVYFPTLVSGWVWIVFVFSIVLLVKNLKKSFASIGVSMGKAFLIIFLIAIILFLVNQIFVARIFL